MATLLDVPALIQLGRLCNRFGVEFELFGGALARLIERTGGAEPTPANLQDLDLFALAPGFSDLDLSHSGPPELTSEIAQAVLDEVPNAECVRWQLRSASDWAIYRTAEHFNNRIPTRVMSLSTDPTIGFKDSLSGAADIRQSDYRYERNSAYPGSPLYKQRLDLELFSGLIYLRAVFESGRNLDLEKQSGMPAVAQVMNEARRLSTIIALQESAYLRSRFYYLLAAIAAAKPLNATKILENSGVSQLLDFIAMHDLALSMRLRNALVGPGSQGNAAMIAARIGGDIYRVSDVTEPWLTGDYARNAMNEMLTSSTRNDTLGDGEHAVIASPPIPIASGTSSSSAPTSSASSRTYVVQEFMYVNLGIPNVQQDSRWRFMFDANRSYAEEDLAVLLATSHGTPRDWTVHALPSAITLRQSNILIGINGWGLFEQLSLVAGPEIRLFILGWRSE